MQKLFGLIESAMPDGGRAEALIDDASLRLALRMDPENALLAFELRAAAAGDMVGDRQARKVQLGRGTQTRGRLALS